MDFVTAHYPFTPAKFPSIEDATEDEIQRFAVRHLALHTGKTVGKIIAAIEPSDHGAALDIEEIRENLPKSLINTLRLASLVGMTGSELLAAIEKAYGEELPG